VSEEWGVTVCECVQVGGDEGAKKAGEKPRTHKTREKLELLRSCGNKTDLEMSRSNKKIRDNHLTNRSYMWFSRIICQISSEAVTTQVSNIGRADGRVVRRRKLLGRRRRRVDRTL
jgi:hypothetical protein